jgi:hypothetical protein
VWFDDLLTSYKNEYKIDIKNFSPNFNRNKYKVNIMEYQPGLKNMQAAQ